MSKVAKKIPNIATPFKFNGIGRLKPDPKWGMRAHYHYFHEIIVVVGGEMRTDIAGKSLHAKTGDVMFYPAGAAHSEKSDAKDPVETIYFSWNEKGLELPFLVHDINGRIRSLAKWMYEENESGSIEGREIQEKLLDALVAEYKRISRYRETDSLTRKIRAFIRDNIKEGLKLEGLAACAGMSKYHFLRKYKSVSGRTPMEEVRLARLEAAKEMLLVSGLPLKSVAEEAGFANEYCLSRMFQKYLGFPPGHFRKKAGPVRRYNRTRS